MHTDRTDTARFWLQEGSTHGFCEKLLEVSPVPDGASACWLQDESVTVHQGEPISGGGTVSGIRLLRDLGLFLIILL